MLHNCPRVQDRKVVKGSESAKKANIEKTAAVTEFAGQASAVAEHEVNFTFFIEMLIQRPCLI